MVSFIGGLSSRTCVLTLTLLSPTELSGEQQHCGEFIVVFPAEHVCLLLPCVLGHNNILVGLLSPKITNMRVD